MIKIHLHNEEEEVAAAMSLGVLAWAHGINSYSRDRSFRKS